MGHELRQLRRDVRRLISVPAPWILLSIAMLLAASTALALAALGAPPSSAAALISVSALASLLGALGAGADFRYGSLAAEMLAVGGRFPFCRRSALAGALVAALGGAAMAGVLQVVWLITAQPASHNLGRICALIAVTAAVASCWSIVGTALVILLRGQIAAISVLLAYLLLVEPMMEVSLPHLAPVMPSRLSATLLALPPVGDIVGALLRLASLALGAFLIASMVMTRRDVDITSS
jgi:ABC-2 type transport system permease protein